MFSTIFKKNFKSQNEKAKIIQAELNKIYEILLKDKSKEKEALSLLDELICEKIKLSDIPQSLNSEGSFILTFSKFWMIIIITTLQQIENLYDKVDKFIELINISLFQNLNEKNEYRKFFEDLCEEFFTDSNAINAINKNEILKKKLNKNNSHFEIKNHYVYLLNKPFSFENNFREENKLNETKEVKNEENKDKNKIKETINSFNHITKEENKNINDNNSQIEKSETSSQNEESEDNKEKTIKKENKKFNKLKAKKIKKKNIKHKTIPNKKVNNDNKKRKKKNKSISLPKNNKKKDKKFSLLEEMTDSFSKELQNMKKKQNKDINNNSNEEIENEDRNLLNSNSFNYENLENFVDFDSNQINDLLFCSSKDLEFSTEI